jgi:hypothetical protein
MAGHWNKITSKPNTQTFEFDSCPCRSLGTRLLTYRRRDNLRMLSNS